MKTLLRKMTLTLVATLLTAPVMSQASIRITNTLKHPIRFAVYQGDVIIGKSDFMPPNVYSTIEDSPNLAIYASIKVGNTISKTGGFEINLNTSADYTALVRVQNGKSEFMFFPSDATSLGTLSLNNTLAQEVMFTISDKNGDLQNIIATPFWTARLSLERRYKILIIANGVTLEPILTTNPNINISVESSKDQDGNEIYIAKH